MRDLPNPPPSDSSIESFSRSSSSATSWRSGSKSSRISEMGASGLLTASAVLVFSFLFLNHKAATPRAANRMPPQDAAMAADAFGEAWPIPASVAAARCWPPSSAPAVSASAPSASTFAAVAAAQRSSFELSLAAHISADADDVRVGGQRHQLLDGGVVQGAGGGWAQSRRGGARPRQSAIRAWHGCRAWR